MESRRTPRPLLLLLLFSMLFSQTLAWPLFGAPSALRLGDRIPYEGEDEPDQASLESDTDILQNVLAENNTPYYDASRNTRHADGVFTSDYSRLLGQLSARKYLESLVGKRVGKDISEGPIKRHSDAVFTDNYTRLRKQMAVKKYLNSILNGKRSFGEIEILFFTRNLVGQPFVTITSYRLAREHLPVPEPFLTISVSEDALLIFHNTIPSQTIDEGQRETDVH